MPSAEIEFLKQIFHREPVEPATEDTRYDIVRFFAPHLKRESEVVRACVTLEEAQEHCSRENTHDKGQWFDGYRRR